MTQEEIYNIAEFVRFIGAPPGFSIKRVETKFNPDWDRTRSPKHMTFVTYVHEATGREETVSRNSKDFLRTIKRHTEMSELRKQSATEGTEVDI